MVIVACVVDCLLFFPTLTAHCQAGPFQEVYFVSRSKFYVFFFEPLLLESIAFTSVGLIYYTLPLPAVRSCFVGRLLRSFLAKHTHLAAQAATFSSLHVRRGVVNEEVA